MKSLRERLAHALGIEPEHRVELVRTMLERHARDRVSYWLQLALATCIATLGLVLGSTGVVIGAMLISPLMGPLVELGMGLGIGSPMLVVRSFWRTAASVAFVVGAAAVMTLLLPYHELTGEILARTTPTVLDLFVAAGCALAAVFTTARSASDTTSAAAGTAIGIALVPPLCVGGYGLGTMQGWVAGGALLLFTANLTAILLVAAVSFVLLRYDQVPVHALEHERLGRGELSVRVGGYLHLLFGTKHGPLLRLLMPLVLMGAVYVPLGEALKEVSWQARVRSEVKRLLESLPETESALVSQLSVGRHSVRVRLAIAGRPEEAGELERTLRERIGVLAGVTPVVAVIAVPNVQAIRELTEATAAAPVPQPVVPPPLFDRVRRELGMALGTVWPTDTAGTLLRVELRFLDGQEPLLEVTHYGESLGPSGEKLLARALTDRLTTPVSVRAQAVPVEPLKAEEGRAGEWLGQAAQAFALARRVPELHACVEVPPAPRRPVPGALDEALVRALAQGLPETRVAFQPGTAWILRLLREPCPQPQPAAETAP